LIVRIVIGDNSRYLRRLAAYRNVELIDAFAYNGRACSDNNVPLFI